MNEKCSLSDEIRVLLADDDENQRAGFAKMIQSWGIAVETAADGQQALDKLSQRPVRVLVTDGNICCAAKDF
jgi:CheY-like chemotaxis protein